MTQRMGIFGGTFDPPHIGHLILAAEAHQQLALDRVYFVLAADPPHKQDREITPVKHRLAMLASAIQDQEKFEISRVEIDRPGPHFALDSLRQFKADKPDAELIYLIGGDSLRDLPKWHKPDEILDLVQKLGVMRRPFTDLNLEALQEQLPQLHSKLEFVDTPLLEISSRELRRKAAHHEHFRNYLHQSVYAYILENQLYSAA
jgi:nicotinate-nucleotide adenylyltransferase